MKARIYIVAVCMAAACGKQEPIVVPDNSSTLSVAQCPAESGDEAETYATELRGTGELRLWLDPELTKPIGAVNSETVYAKAFSDSVWAVLVNDYAGTVCEGYVSHENVIVVGVLSTEPE